MESILDTVKSVCNISTECKDFDSDIMMHTNTAFSTLAQIGVGPINGFSISSSSTTWDEFMPKNPRLEMVKTYVGSKVRLIFDPPQNSTHLQALKDVISELEWRLSVEVDPGQPKETE